MKKGFYFLPLILFFLPGKAQNPGLEATFKVYAEQYQPEKIHIHFDKDAYLPGETVWLKAYLLEGSKPSGRSKNIYFDFSDSKGNLLQHFVAPVLESGANGSFSLPVDFGGGALHVKAYTTWMLNFDSSFIYNKNIPVLSPWDGTVQTPERIHTSLRFYPEGGDLVNGLVSQVAFEATEEHGRPVNVRGVVINSSGLIVDSFATKHDGMGSFALRPLANEKYTAYWKDEQGYSYSTELPQARTEGIVLHLSKGPGHTVHYQLERSLQAADDLKSVTVVSTLHQKLISQTRIDLKENPKSSGEINPDPQASGILQLTVFDASMRPMAERIMFVNAQKYSFNTTVRAEAANFNRKGKNEISIEIPEGFAADLSVSVTDGGLVSDSSSNIISDLLLSSEIRGNIVNPAYYFSSPNDSTAYYLDLVMKTHGWRRYKWDELFAGKLPALPYGSDNEYLALKGQVGGANHHFDNSDSVALLVITKDRKKNLLSLPVNPDGSFVQNGMFFYDSIQIVYKLNHAAKIGSGADISFQTSLMPQGLPVTQALEPSFQWSKVPDAILEKEIDGLLAELKNYSRLAPAMDYVITPHARIDSFKNTSETAAHYLESNFPFRFPYAARNAQTGNEAARFTSQKSGGSQPQTPAAPKYNINLMLDGNPVTMEDLKQISMKEVLFIKIIDRSSPKDLQTLAISSRLAAYQENIINSKTGFAIVRGYTAPKEFYVPQYTGNPEDDRSEDFRSTLYWNPRVILDKDHRKIKLSFYNNDLSSKFRVIVEGMNTEGKLTRAEQIIR